MFEKFTPEARRVVVLAQEEARTLGHGIIFPHHLLIALTRDETGAKTALASLGADSSAVTGTVLAVVDTVPAPQSGVIPFSPRSRQVLTAARNAAFRLGSQSVRPEHLLLALTLVEDTVTGNVLKGLGITRRDVLEALAELLVRSGDFTPEAAKEIIAKVTPHESVELYVARTADEEVSLHLDRDDAIMEAGDGGSVHEGRLPVRPGEFFSIRDHSYVRDDLRYLDYAMASDTAKSARAQVCLMVPVTRDVTALAADGTERVVGSTTEWSALNPETRVTLIG